MAAPLIAATIASFLTSGTVAAQSLEQLQAWFDAEWARARGPLGLDGFRVSYTAESHEVAPAGEIERLRRVVREHPDHPDRERLETYERRLKHGPDRFEVTVWFGEPGVWRINLTDSLGGWFDTAKHQAGAWRLGRDQLTLLSAGPHFPPGLDPASSEQDFQERLRFFLFGGFHLSGALGLKPEPIERTDAGWRLRAAGPFESVVRFEGVWDSSVGRGFVRRIVLESVPPSPDEEGQTWEIDGWHQSDVDGAWMAKTYSEKRRDGGVIQRLILGPIEHVSPDVVRELTTPPPFDGADPIRGPVTIRSIMDYSSGLSPLAQRVTPTGLQVVPLPNPAPRTRWLRPAGWVAAAAIVLALVALRARARGASQMA